MRKVNEQFPPAKVEVKPFIKRRNIRMFWTYEEVQKVTARAAERGLPPWEIVGIRKKAGKLVYGNYEQPFIKRLDRTTYRVLEVSGLYEIKKAA